MKKIIIHSTLALTAMLGLLPATGNASTLFTFSQTGPSAGTVGTGTVSGVTFNLFTVGAGGFIKGATTYAAGTTCAVAVTEAYASTTLSYSVTGGGTMGSANCSNGASNPFLNISGSSAFLSLTETTSPASFAPNGSAQTLSLYTAQTTVTGSTFLQDLGFALGVVVQTAPISSTMAISVAYNGTGGVTSSNTAFTLTAVPEPSTLLLFGGALLFAGRKSRRKLLSSPATK